MSSLAGRESCCHAVFCLWVTVNGNGWVVRNIPVAALSVVSALRSLFSVLRSPFSAIFAYFI
ncbi:MAG: hypothetical protein LBG58_09005 [Planctomycetaceae bacterium]|nr:hypothetical protein [Planctomycetaceae bacterium]